MEVADYQSPISWASQTDMLEGRDKISNLLQKIIDERTELWGINVISVEVKDDATWGACRGDSIDHGVDLSYSPRQRLAHGFRNGIKVQSKNAEPLGSLAPWLPHRSAAVSSGLRAWRDCLRHCRPSRGFVGLKRSAPQREPQSGSRSPRLD